RDTQGGLLAAGGGNQELGAAVRYGGKLGESGNFRIYGKRRDFDGTARSALNTEAYDWQNGQAGFRADSHGAGQGINLQGNLYTGESERRQRQLSLFGTDIDIDPSERIKVSGMNLLARWNRELAGGSTIQLQSYFDHIERKDPFAFRDEMDIFDVEFQHGIPL